MGFHDNDPTPVSEPVPMGFDPDGDPTPVQVPQLRHRSFPDPFDGDTVVAEPVLDFEVSPARPRLKTPGREIPDVLRPPPSITDSGRVIAVDPPEETAPTAPISLDAEDLFDSVEESPLPPPMMMDPPTPRQLPLPWRGSAVRSAAAQARGASWLVMSVCAAAGAVVASAGFLIAGWLSEPTPPPPTVRSTVEAIKRTRPAASSIVHSAAEPARIKLPPPQVVVERPVAAPKASVDDQPTSRTGEQIASAIRPCLRRRLDRTLRVAVYLLPAGTVRRVFVAKRPWLTPYQQRCIKRRLVGLELRGFKHAGYADWRLTLHTGSQEGVLVRRRGL
jgi:hypothetical protein